MSIKGPNNEGGAPGALCLLITCLIKCGCRFKILNPAKATRNNTANTVEVAKREIARTPTPITKIVP